MKRLLTWILKASFCLCYSDVPPVGLRGLPTYIPQKVSISSLLLESIVYITYKGSCNWGHRDNYLYLGKETHSISHFLHKRPFGFLSVWVLATNCIPLFDLELLGSSFWTRQLGRNWNNIWVLVGGCVLLSRVSLAHLWQIAPHAYLEFSASLRIDCGMKKDFLHCL